VNRYARLADDQLLVQTRDDVEAFAEFYDRRAQDVLRFFLWRGLPREDAVDLTAEVFAAVLTSVHRYRPERGPATAWLYAIARNKLSKSLRRGRVERAARIKLGLAPVSFSDEALDRVEEQLDASQQVSVDQLDALPPAERSAVQARVIDGRDYEGIAAEQRATAAAIRQRVQRGLTKLGKTVRELP
jgi:RNA polymerase sigma-70 factor, ECF subfamily